MFNKSDISRDEFMLTKGQAKCGYDWWWHSFTGHNEKTGKYVNRYYLDIFNTEFTITGHYNSKDIVSSKKLLLDKPYLFFKLYKETKEIYEYKKYEIKEEEAYQLALSKSEGEIKKKLNKGEYIISKKVLKKRSNSSKMYIEVFFKVYKNIAYTSNIDIIGEKDGTST